MRSQTEFDRAMNLVRSGLNDCQVARRTGIPRRTIRDWRARGRRTSPSEVSCPFCGPAELNQSEYLYLLGLYLGDGCLSEHHGGVFRLRITLDSRYPGIVEECCRAISRVVPSKHPGITQKEGCVEVSAYWKHWPCLFPQHGPGKKHLRKIELQQWQKDILLSQPKRLLRGLIQSDGSRYMNKVNGTNYPRYEFTNNSSEIRELFCWACDLLEISYRQMNWKSISVARKTDTAKLDLFVGPKA